ncbi:MAG: putative DNA binding domain-containing protein [Bacilli bacterium]
MFIEDEFTELKIKLTTDIKKEVVAFANTNGGKIYIGIDDLGNVVGLESVKEDIESLSGMIREGIESDLSIYTNIDCLVVENKNVILLSIMEAPDKPYYLANKGMKPSGVYIRYGNTSAPASKELIKKMLIDNQASKFEVMISSNQNLHFEQFYVISKEQGIEIKKDKFKSLNIINLDNLYTNLGLLLSDECPYSIKCAIYNADNKIDFLDRKEFTGSVLKQINDVFDYLLIYNKIKSSIVGLKRVDTNDYPVYALRESLLNAIIHRDYNYSGSILISLFEDRFEITSLGGLVKGLNLDDLYLGISESRNKNLAEIFHRLQYVECFGTGIGRIIDSYSKYDLKPILLDTGNAFKVTLFNINFRKKIERDILLNLSHEEIIIEYLNKNNKVSRLTVEKLLNVSKTRSISILNNMINNEIIIHVGKGKNTMYLLK